MLNHHNHPHQVMVINFTWETAEVIKLGTGLGRMVTRSMTIGKITGKAGNVVLSRTVLQGTINMLQYRTPPRYTI
jgi:hypothetical protein